MSLVGQSIKHTQIQRHLASGGMAEIYLAYDSLNRLPVVVKVLNLEASQNPALVKRFRQEAETMRRLSHPYIVRVFDIGRTGDQTYMIMDYAPGGTLRDEMVTSHRNGHPVPLSRSLDLMRKVIGAIAHLHDQEIVHRDLKPANILLKDPHTPMVTDLGIAGVNAAETLTQVGQVFGTLDYMSPEQGLDASKADARADIYALGVILFELLSGRLPFDGDSALIRLSQKQLNPPLAIQALRPDLAPHLCRIVDTCLQSKPENRYRSAAELAQAFDRYLGPGPQTPPPTSKSQLSRPFPSQSTPPQQMKHQVGSNPNNSWVLYGFGGVALLLISVILGLFFFTGNVAPRIQATATPPPTQTPALPSVQINLDMDLACPGPHEFGSSSQIEFKWTGPTNEEVNQSGVLYLVVRQNGSQIWRQQINAGENRSQTPGEWIYFNTPSTFNANTNGDYTWRIEFREGTQQEANLISQSAENCFTVLNHGGGSGEGEDNQPPTPIPGP